MTEYFCKPWISVCGLGTELSKVSDQDRTTEAGLKKYVEMRDTVAGNWKFSLFRIVDPHKLLNQISADIFTDGERLVNVKCTYLSQKRN